MEPGAGPGAPVPGAEGLPGPRGPGRPRVRLRPGLRQPPPGGGAGGARRRRPEDRVPWSGGAASRARERAPGPGMETDLIHAQGPEAELDAAARRALAWVRDGVPPAEIAILARSGLEPYEPVAETVFARHRLPVEQLGDPGPVPPPQGAGVRAPGPGPGRGVRAPDRGRSAPLPLLPAAGGGAGGRRPLPSRRMGPLVPGSPGGGGLSDWTRICPRRSGDEAPEPGSGGTPTRPAIPESRRPNVASAELLAAPGAEWAEERPQWSRRRNAAEHARS